MAPPTSRREKPARVAHRTEASVQDALLTSDSCRLPVQLDAAAVFPSTTSDTIDPLTSTRGGVQHSLIGDASDGFPRTEGVHSRLPKPQTASSPASPRQPHHKTVIIVVNVLPLVFERNATDSGWNIEWSSSSTSLFYRNLVGDSGRFRPLFIGCPEVFVRKEEEATVERQLCAFDCIPVFLDPVVAHRYFQGFCKGVLWPIFHNVVDVYNSAKLALDEFKEEKTGNNAPATVTRDASPPSPTSTGDKPSWCDPASWNPAAQDSCWADYCSVNRTFARRIIESYYDGYMIWIHDFHFLMLPSYLLRKLRSTMIASYLHVPFPSSEIFRCLAMRTEILRAMLCADHIGFLIFEHARHFLTSCKRLLGLNYSTSPDGMLVVEYNGRKVNISCSHIEPDVRYLHRILDQHHTDREDSARRFRKQIERFVFDPATGKRKFVIAAVDRLEGLSALPLKLRAFDRFLALHPSKRGSVVLIQIGISLDSRPNDYHQTRDYVRKFADEINRRWSRGSADGDRVVYFEERAKATCAERMHLWRLSDLYLDTCVRYGLSLLPFEFLVAQRRNLEQATEGDTAHQFGAMIVSEFASYSRILNGSLLVNPWKADDIVAALVKATEMQYYEKLNRFQLNYKFLSDHSETRWADRLLLDFETLMQQKLQAKATQGTVEVGFGFDYRVMQFASGFDKLDLDEVVRASSRSATRLFVFDYGGTLSWTTSILEETGAAHHFHQRGVSNSPMEMMKGPGAIPKTGCFAQEALRSVDGQVRTPLSHEARENLQTLCEDLQNVVFVVSTGRRAELDAEFGAIPNLNLVSDNGLFLKKADPKGATWECVLEPSELSRMDWKDEAHRLMQSYAARTNGSFLVVGEASVLYDYRHSDPEYGEIQALELYEQLRQLVKKREATIHRAKGYIEVRQVGVSKSVAMAMILHRLKESVGVPEFALYVGDDESDEQAFKALQTFAEVEPALAHVFTCTVGMKPSAAKHYVDSVTDVLAVIHAIAVRLRHGSNRRSGPASFLTKGYLDRFLDHDGGLVDRAVLQALATLNSGSEVASEAFGGASVHEDVDHIESKSENTASTWVALGAGLAIGAVVGVALSNRSFAHRILRHFHTSS